MLISLKQALDFFLKLYQVMGPHLNDDYEVFIIKSEDTLIKLHSNFNHRWPIHTAVSSFDTTLTYYTPLHIYLVNLGGMK